jgi:hypothetical protein
MSEDIRKMIDKVKNFKQFVNESKNRNEYSDLMTKCVQYTDLRDKLDGEYEEYVRCKIQDLINQEDYFEAKNQVYRYYKNARLNNQGDFDKEFDVVLMGYENIMRDISKLSRSVDIGREFSSNCNNINHNDAVNKLNKAVEYDSFIIKTGDKTADYISNEIDNLLKQDKAEEALKVLTDFYKESYMNGYSCFIEHDMLKARILRYLKKA